MKNFWRPLSLSLIVLLGVLMIYRVNAENDPYNAKVDFGDSQEVKIYEEYPFRRLNDLNTHYVMRNGQEVYIEKVVDLTTGIVYFVTSGSKYGTAVSITPVYDSNGQIMKLTPENYKVEVHTEK